MNTKLAIECLKTQRQFVDDMTKKALSMAIKALEAQEWISCKERLPEENLPVLVAVKQKDRLPKWVKEQTYSYVTDIDAYDDGDFDTHKNKVVAWKSLPEPYREDTEKNNPMKGDRYANEDICACHLNLLPTSNRVRGKDVNCE